MNDLKPFKHGSEGTHYACEAGLAAITGVWCCGCSGHKCKESKPEPWEEEFRKMWSKWSNPDKYLSHNDLKKATKQFIKDTLTSQRERDIKELEKFKDTGKSDGAPWFNLGIDTAIDYLKGKGK